MEKIKILEWNINQRSSSQVIPSYVPSEILKKNPDIVVLVEFKDDVNHYNTESLKEKLSNYHIYFYNGIPDTAFMIEHKTTGNGILIALKKDKFNKLNKVESPNMSDNVNLPNWCRVKTTLASGTKLTITGLRVKMQYESPKDFRERKEQIEWLLKENNKDSESDNQIIIGDLNYGPHRKGRDIGLNWDDFVAMIREYKYCDSETTNFAPYSPSGLSWGNEQLDWLITRGVELVPDSSYNALDWGFDRFIDKVKPTNVKESHVKRKTGVPDHAIFTAELQVPES